MNIQRHYEMTEDDGMEADEAVWFAETSRRQHRQTDRLVNWGFFAAIVAVGVWAVFA